MQQKIEVKLLIPVPAEYVMIKKVEYQELKQSELLGRYWTMKDLEERTGMKSQWLKENILYKPKFKVQLEKFVYYPNSQGGSGVFRPRRWLNF